MILSLDKFVHIIHICAQCVGLILAVAVTSAECQIVLIDFGKAT